ncbi:MAG: hypothetical protein ACI9G1_004274, partial [Pirellulaceae bacterium]
MQLIPTKLAITMAACLFTLSSSAEPLHVLFLGDNAGHKPIKRFEIMQPALAPHGIEITYTDKLDDLNSETLGKYDALLIYANHMRITPEQEKALLGYV